MINTVIFDMDGVLIDSEDLHAKAVSMVLDKLGVKNKDALKGRRVGAISYAKTWASLVDELDINKPLDEIIQLQYDTSYEFFKRLNLSEISGATNCIKRFRNMGYKIAVGSSAPVKLIGLILDKLGLSQYIDTFCGTEFVESPKPDPDIYLWVADKLEVDRKNCLVIEDSKNGLRAAKGAGMKCVVLNSNKLPKSEFKAADKVTDSFSEINDELVNQLIAV